MKHAEVTNERVRKEFSWGNCVKVKKKQRKGGKGGKGRKKCEKNQEAPGKFCSSLSTSEGGQTF